MLAFIRVARLLASPTSPRTIARRASSAMASPAAASASGGHTLASLPKTWRFPQSLPADPQLPTPAASHAIPRDDIQPRAVRAALFSWVRPEEQEDPELLAVSPAALQDLGLLASEAETDAFRQTAAGNRLWGWDEADGMDEAKAACYPWAQCYGGFQFGQWSGQLGDGRAISLFEVPAAASDNAHVYPSYEVQLKGAGITPYSRFADGRAVLRSSIREFVVSEALHALGIPSTRALALTLLPQVLVHRERLEPAAVVVRFAPSWLRLGTFDLLRARADTALIRRLATYVAESVLGGWEALPARLHVDTVEDKDGTKKSKITAADIPLLLKPPRVVAPDTLQGPPAEAENRFARLYREAVRRNAGTVARWQAYGFINGVLNTDNTSIAGLSMDFGPFAFLDNFDPDYTPNHDDHYLRYSYKNQPSVIWWNLVRFGESLGQLLAAADRVDHPVFVADGILGLAKMDAAADASSSTASFDDAAQAAADKLAGCAETIIMRAGDEYKALFLAEYRRLFAARLGLDPPDPAALAPDADTDPLLLSLLDTMERLELDFNLFFRRLSSIRLADIAHDEARRNKAGVFFYREGLPSGTNENEARRLIADWLSRWHDRLLVQGTPDNDRIRAMKAVNPNFVPRGWILDEVIRRVEKGGERDVLRRIMHMALHPFADSWHGQIFDSQVYSGDLDEETRWTQDVPQKSRAMQCSCSS